MPSLRRRRANGGRELASGFVVAPSAIQRGVETAPAASVRLLEAQMGGGRGGAVHGEDGVCELEEDIFPLVRHP